VTQTYRVNRQIRVSQVRLIDHEGKQIGVVPIEEARRKADDVKLDLVEVSPNVDPPVCRILDFGKFKYEQRKKEKGGSTKKHASQVKELRVRPAIGGHDLEYRIQQGRGFLEDGYKVQIVCVFRGRQMAHPQLGRQVIMHVVDKLADICKVDGSPKLMGNRMTTLLVRK
jgi:translation initiation factor IF-3